MPRLLWWRTHADLGQLDDLVPGPVGASAAPLLVGGCPRPAPLRDVPPGHAGVRPSLERAGSTTPFPRSPRRDCGSCGPGSPRPTNEHFQLRDVAALKLFFNELGEPGNVQRLAREQIVQHEQRIKVH